MPTIDEGFIARVYRTSAYCWAFGFLAWWAAAGLAPAIGWTLGSLLSVGGLWSLEYVIRRHFRPAAYRPRRALARLSILKLVVVLLVLYVAIMVGKGSFVSIIAFCAGVILAQAVIVLKVVGMLLVERLNR